MTPATLKYGPSYTNLRTGNREAMTAVSADGLYDLERVDNGKRSVIEVRPAGTRGPGVIYRTFEGAADGISNGAVARFLDRLARELA